MSTIYVLIGSIILALLALLVAKHTRGFEKRLDNDYMLISLMEILRVLSYLLVTLLFLLSLLIVIGTILEKLI